MAPTVTSYDPLSSDEQPVPLPSAPLVVLRDNIVLQPPLSRHGSGPGVIVFLPQLDHTNANPTKSLDPEPVSKWAEEGFAVVGVTASDGLSVGDALKLGLDALQALDKVDIKDKFGVIGTLEIRYLCFLYSR
jgi:carboxymethylenebutenolidase